MDSVHRLRCLRTRPAPHAQRRRAVGGNCRARSMHGPHIPHALHSGWLLHARLRQDRDRVCDWSISRGKLTAAPPLPACNN